MSRPDNLPDFRNPPLTEVVVGIQFNPPVGYQQIQAYEVWSLFRDEFPFVEEHQPLQPQFETFGRPQGPTINFGLVTGAVHDRFIFLSPEGNNLIQFQNDRYLRNWRKNGVSEAAYPRFESMIEAFESEVTLLFDYFSTTSGEMPEITQAEISYLNVIPLSEGERASDWYGGVNFALGEPSDFTMNFRNIIVDANGAPQGRLIVESAFGFAGDGSKAILLNLTARGKPAGTSLSDALEFLTINREMVVNSFADLTTDSAHKKWERV